MRITNSSEYGLTAAVYTRDTLTQNRAARHIDSGMIWINNYYRALLGVSIYCSSPVFS